MDQRKEQLKSLKKEYKRERRRVVTPWKTLAILGFLGAVILAAAGAYSLYGEMVVPYLPAEILPYITAKLLKILRAGALVALAVGISASIMWGNGNRKLKRSEAFLNWRTMKEVLHTEKTMQ